MIKVEGGEKESGEKTMSRRRKKSSAYLVFVFFVLGLAYYIYYSTHNLIFALILIALGVGIAISNR